MAAGTSSHLVGASVRRAEPAPPPCSTLPDFSPSFSWPLCSIPFLCLLQPSAAWSHALPLLGGSPLELVAGRASWHLQLRLLLSFLSKLARGGTGLNPRVRVG
uniref:Uncharacterized protein n=1 Tax=Arundo donax TaxID=35708 RepID=A0A0A9FDG9_ARUDO